MTNVAMTPLWSLRPEVSIHGNLILQTPIQESFVCSVRPVVRHPVLVQYFSLRRHFDLSDVSKEGSGNPGRISLTVAQWGHIIRLIQHIPDSLIRAYTGFRFRRGVLLEAHTHLTEARRKGATVFTVVRHALDSIHCGVFRELTAVIMYSVMHAIDLQRQILSLRVFLHVLWSGTSLRGSHLENFAGILVCCDELLLVFTLKGLPLGYPFQIGVRTVKVCSSANPAG